MIATQPTFSASARAAGWVSKGIEPTESFEDRQGTAILLNETYRSWMLIIKEKKGDKATLGIWGVDSSGRDALIYNGPFDEGQEIAIDMQYRNVHIAVNFVLDEPPQDKRWSVAGHWYRQSTTPAHAVIEKWIYR